MNAPAYPKTKKSGVEWLGDIPEHWDVRRLKFLAEEPLKYGANEAAELDDRDLPRFIRITDVNDSGTLREETFRSIPADIAEPYLLKEGDILLARSGATVGKSFQYLESWGKAAFAGYLIRFRVDSEQLYPRFACHFFRTKAYWNWVNSSLIQATIQNVSAEKYASVSLPVPPLNEQKTIAEFLDRKTGRIDELIGKKKELIQKLNEQRSALITAAVTGKIPEIGSRKSAVRMKDSGVEWLGKIPEHWEVRRLKFLTKVIGGGTPSTGNSKYWNGDIPWVSPKDMKSDLIDSAQDNITELGAAESATKIVQLNTVLVVVRSGILRHTIPVARNTVQVALNQDMKGFTPENGLTPEYLHLLIAGNQKQLLPLWSKPGCTVESLEVELMMNTEIPVPPALEQQAIAEYLDVKTGKIDGLIRKTETAIQTLEEYRTALITAAVTGKIDVRKAI